MPLLVLFYNPRLVTTPQHLFVFLMPALLATGAWGYHSHLTVCFCILHLAFTGIGIALDFAFLLACKLYTSGFSGAVLLAELAFLLFKFYFFAAWPRLNWTCERNSHGSAPRCWSLLHDYLIPMLATHAASFDFDFFSISAAFPQPRPTLRTLLYLAAVWLCPQGKEPHQHIRSIQLLRDGVAALRDPRHYPKPRLGQR
jgi:hypothetical protein